ncbi:MAG: ATP-binding protein [Candidatus Omnitrophica bacterium]|nr:ATP-binding protein [Candidatus Omnitrophota bacterium]MBU4302869.1 ATP-binding protein [Candidatus Omnitrophota bacterium]MBU4468739.1 ATP-binding protein [Candidatus Omnitrophota bacterium]MCG2708231.1 ATP-binding protein [Candidatus Omnitrophota bacterium]
MIYSFSFKNFCSFADKATISFEEIRKGVDTDSNMFINTPLGTRLSKVMIIIGSNASGKTNALKALAFLSWFVPNSFNGLEGENSEIPFDAFIFSEDQERTSEFELVFEHNMKVYKYVLHLCKTHVIKEELYQKEETNFFNYLFKRNWNPQIGASDISQRINLETEIVKKILRKNVSLISASVAINNNILIEIAGYWQKIIGNVIRRGKSWDPSSLGDRRLVEATKAYVQNDNLFKKVELFLKDSDLGLEGISLEGTDDPTKVEGKKNYLPFGLHKVNDKQYKLPMIYESNGTKNMFVLLHFLLPVIEVGGIAVIDELEMDLHPHALPKIIELFINPAINPKNSQLLFTSHSLDILNHLEKEQVILVEKRKDCKSVLYRLDELKGVRRDDNIYAKYMAGAYGAVPNI